MFPLSRLVTYFRVNPVVSWTSSRIRDLLALLAQMYLFRFAAMYSAVDLRDISLMPHILPGYTVFDERGAGHFV